MIRRTVHTVRTLPYLYSAYSTTIYVRTVRLRTVCVLYVFTVTQHVLKPLDNCKIVFEVSSLVAVHAVHGAEELVLLVVR